MEIVKVILDTIRFIPFIPRSVLFCLIMLSRNRLWTHMPPVVILFVCIDSNSLCNRARLTSQALVEEHWTVSGLWFRREARERANTRALVSTRETLTSSRVACLPSLACIFCPPFCLSLKLETTRSLKEFRPLEFPKKNTASISGIDWMLMTSLRLRQCTKTKKWRPYQIPDQSFCLTVDIGTLVTKKMNFKFMQIDYFCS